MGQLKYKEGEKKFRIQRVKLHGQGPRNECVVIDCIVRGPGGVPCAMGPSPSVDNAVSYTSLPRLIKNRQIDVTGTVELCLTLARPHLHVQ